jgi:hypothetical protein
LFHSLGFVGIYSSSVGAPARLVEQNNRAHLEGEVTSTNANFTAGTTFNFGTLPTWATPATVRRFACTSNGTAVAAIYVWPDGTLSLTLNTTFTGALSLSLGGCSWNFKGAGSADLVAEAHD